MLQIISRCVTLEYYILRTVVRLTSLHCANAVSHDQHRHILYVSMHTLRLFLLNHNICSISSISLVDRYSGYFVPISCFHIQVTAFLRRGEYPISLYRFNYKDFNSCEFVMTHPFLRGSSVTGFLGAIVGFIQWRTFVIINIMLGGELLSCGNLLD